MCIIGGKCYTYQYLPHVLPKLSFVVNSSDNWPGDPYHPSPVPFNWCHQLFMRVGSSRARRPPLPNVLRVWYEKNCNTIHNIFNDNIFQIFLQIIFKFWYTEAPFRACGKRFFFIRFCNYILEWLSIFLQVRVVFI